MPPPRKPALLLACLILAWLPGCADTYVRQPGKPHHGPDGFRNNPPHAEAATGFWRWQWQRRQEGKPPLPAAGYPVVGRVEPDLPFLHHNRDTPTATWINHASVLFQVGGLNIVTDPIWSDRASPVTFAGPRRRAAPGLTVEQLPRIDVVLISHNHYDHLDRASVHALAERADRQTLFLVPLGLKAWFEAEGLHNVQELDWWERHRIGNVDFHFAPAQHWSKRSLFDRNQTLWGSWVIADGRRRICFVGDTGYSADFRTIRDRLGPVDLAALPIGAYLPRWFMAPQHVDPAEAVRIHQDLGAAQSLAIHWGTFEMADEALDQPPRDLAAALAAAGLPPEIFRVLRHGETLRIQD